MKKVWVLTEKQLSKGYVTRRGYKSTGQPQKTKLIPLALRFETQQKAEESKIQTIETIKTEIALQEKDLAHLDVMAIKEYKLVAEYKKDCDSIYGMYYYRDFYDSNYKEIVAWDDRCDKIRNEGITKKKNEASQRLNRLKKEAEFWEKHIYSREVEMGFRWRPQDKRDIKFVKNDCNTYCNSCGCDVPDVFYMQVGYLFKLCPMCIEKMLPQFKNIVDETPKEIKDLHSSEQFLNGIG